MKGVKILSNVLNNKLVKNRNEVVNAINQFNGKDVIISIYLAEKTRSNEQNAYYWGVIITMWQDILKDNWGEYYSKEYTHEFLKYNLNYKENINLNTDVILRVVKSTTQNTTTDQEEYCEKCRRLALDMFNVVIPLPNEVNSVDV